MSKDISMPLPQNGEAGSETPPERDYEFHWLDGTVTTGKGRDPADAINRLGFGRGALRALDYYCLANSMGTSEGAKE